MRIIHTEEENQRCTGLVELLLRKRGRTGEEDRVLELPMLLIEDFEERNYSMAPARPRHKHSRSVKQPVKRK